MLDSYHKHPLWPVTVLGDLTWEDAVAISMWCQMRGVLAKRVGETGAVGSTMEIDREPVDVDLALTPQTAAVSGQSAAAPVENTRDINGDSNKNVPRSSMAFGPQQLTEPATVPSEPRPRAGNDDSVGTVLHAEDI